MNLKSDAEIIIKDAIQKVLPDEAVVSALKGKTFDTGRIYVVAAGKAAWQMAKTASDILKEQITAGIVITKYGHVKGNISNITCFEAGHPIPDDNSYRATGEVLTLVNNLHEHDTVLFLLSGGGSALFEKPLVSKEEMADITGQLLECGADIVEINTVRKRLSAVKGGKFAKLCEPAHIYSIVLSDIIGDPLDMIASGPAYPDSTTCSMAEEIIKKYNLSLSDEAEKLLKVETPKSLSNVETIVTGSVRNLCKAAAEKCRKMGYETFVLTDQLCCEAREAGTFLACIAKTYQNTNHSLAFIAGGETVVHVTGDGKGGRNQELVLSAALGIDGLMDTAVFSIGSDGTDGPTDAAGGYADNNTKRILEEKGVNIYEYLRRNDAYNALKKCDGLIFTGATGTNVNDVAVMLIKR
jgi:glycerate 2-kinase